MPAVDDLFRPTVVPDPAETSSAEPDSGETGSEAVESARATEAPAKRRAPRTPSGRVRHDEKMTVYVTAEELLELEHARLTLRRSGLSVDRGRLVREAVAIVLADLEEHGDDSVIVQRLMQA